MANKTKIEWCDATINPACGCTKISTGCENCYAAKIASRFAGGDNPHPFYKGTAKNGEWTGKINLMPDRMAEALKRKKPTRYFVGSMCDMFHDDVPFGFLEVVFAYMASASQHTFMLLTKRPERMLQYTSHRYREQPLPNVWLGTTICNQAEAERNIPLLLQCQASKRFVSIRDQCIEAVAPFFLKHVSKQSGRLLDGREWNEVPVNADFHR